MSPLISVIIPCFNQAEFLGYAIASVMAQTYQNWECIVVDDGSSDDTAAIALEYSSGDVRISYIFQENGGLSSARNKGISIARGEFIQYLDADDYIAPEKFQLSVNEIISSSCDIVVTDFKMFIIDPGDATPAFCEIGQSALKYDNLLLNWGWKFVIPINCGLFKAGLFTEVKFNESLKSMEDWVMWIMIFRSGPTACFLDRPLAYYRNNPNSMTKDKGAYRHQSAFAFKHIFKIIPDDMKSIFAVSVIDHYYNENMLLHQELDRLNKTFVLRSLNNFKKQLRKILAITKFS